MFTIAGGIVLAAAVLFVARIVTVFVGAWLDNWWYGVRRKRP